MSPAVEAVAPPPPYEGGPPLLFDLNCDLQSPPIVAQFSAYTPSQRPTNARAGVGQEPKEFYYELKKKGRLFAALTIVSDATYSKHMPTFLEGKPLEGRVRLTLDKPDAILSIIVSVSSLPPQARREGILQSHKISVTLCW